MKLVRTVLFGCLTAAAWSSRRRPARLQAQVQRRLLVLLERQQSTLVLPGWQAVADLSKWSVGQFSAPSRAEHDLSKLLLPTRYLLRRRVSYGGYYGGYDGDRDRPGLYFGGEGGWGGRGWGGGRGGFGGGRGGRR